MATVQPTQTIAPGYEPVVAAFRDGVLDDSGASLSIWRDGTEVVNAWQGTRDERTGEPWTDTTTSVLFSCTKGLSSLVMAQLHEQGILDLLAPIADAWPEFAAHGKGALSIADVLAHRAGVSAPVDDLTIDDAIDSRAWAARIAAQAPLWHPGAGHAYHAVTFGVIVQELVRRATGRELHELFDENIASPLDADVTLKGGDGDLERVAHLATSSDWEALARADIDDRIVRALTLGGAFPLTLATEHGGFNDRRVQAAGFAASGGIGTASGLARIWSATIRPTLGVELLRPETVALISAVRSEGPWAFPSVGPWQRWGAGVELASDAAPHLSPTTFGHGGAGGQAGFADPLTGIALGYVRNRLDTSNPIAPLLAPLARALRA